MLKYSFLNHPIYNFIDYLHSDNKGIKNAYGLFCNYKKRIELISISENIIQPVSLSKNISRVQKFRNEAIHLSWINTNVIPFISKKELKVKQLTLEDEKANSWLVLKFNSPIDHGFDVLLIEISGLHSFGISRFSNAVNSGDKSLIGNLFNMMVSSRIKDDYSNYKTLQLVNTNYETQMNRIDLLEKQNNIIQKNAFKTIELFINSLKNKWQTKTGLTIEVSDSVLPEIIKSNQNINFIEKCFENAVYIALNTSRNNTKKITLEQHHFNWESSTVESSNQNSFGKYANIIEFLDRYEKATKTAINNGWKINGSTVGKCCQPSVSPASITFNLKKYSKQVVELVNQYDQRWSNLTTYFRPLQNIINSSSSNQEALTA